MAGNHDPGLGRELTAKAEEKREAIEYIDDVLALFEDRGQPLDHWERFHLCDAVGWASRGGYSFGAMQAYLALTPEADRNVDRYPLPTHQAYERAHLVVLRKALGVAESEPVRLFPQLGRVVFTS